MLCFVQCSCGLRTCSVRCFVRRCVRACRLVRCFVRQSLIHSCLAFFVFFGVVFGLVVLFGVLFCFVGSREVCSTECSVSDCSQEGRVRIMFAERLALFDDHFS